MPTRAVTVTCLIQVFLLFVAWMLTSKFTSMAESAWEKLDRFHTPRLFEWLCGYRMWGLLLLAVPVIVALLGAWLSSTHRDIAIVGRGGIWIAMLSLILVTGFAIFVTGCAGNYAATKW